MFYGDEVIISREAIRVSPKAIQPIGIVNGSRCWGIWLRDVRGLLPGKPPHLLLSAFKPQTWPILFRITLKVHDQPGTAEKVARVLAELDFNILFTESVPSGHRHLTWNIIGEALRLKDRVASLQIPDIPKDRDVSEQPDVLDFVSRDFSPLMLNYAIELKERLLAADAELRRDGDSGFLHERFVNQQTLLYDVRRLPATVRDRVHCQILAAVECSWLQNFAAFWLFGEERMNPIAFRYRADTDRVEPEHYDRERYGSVVESSVPKPPAVGVASFAHDEQYVRIALPAASDGRLRISLPFTCDISAAGATSKGLLHGMMAVLREAGLNIDYVRNATTELTMSSEAGRISFLCSGAQQDKRRELRERLAGIRHPYARLSEKDMEIASVGAKVLFLSSRLEWVTAKPSLISELRKLAERYGFSLKTGMESVDTHVEQDVVKRIQESDAFLQVIPDYGEWVSYELGVARGCNLVVAVCLDPRRVRRKQSKVMQGWRAFTFSADKDTDGVVRDLEAAVEWLQSEAYNRK